MSVVLGVPGARHHRIGGDPHAESMARTLRWTRYLQAAADLRGKAIDLAIAAYGHRLYEGVALGHGGSPDPLASLNTDAADLARQWLAALELPEVARHGRLTVPLHHAVAYVARRFGVQGRLTDQFVARFFTDAELYFRAGQPDRRTAARDEVVRAFRDHRPRMVIAHSFGAVPAFEALHAAPDVEVECFVTLGAPLAVPGAIFQRLRPAPSGGIGLRPPGVRRWVNIADVGDPFTVLRPNRRYFPGIDVDVEDHVGLVEFHRARGYLRCSAMSQTLLPFVDR